MKTLKNIAEILGHALSIVFSVTCIVGLLWFVKQHVTCVDLVTNWCVIH